MNTSNMDGMFNQCASLTSISPMAPPNVTSETTIKMQLGDMSVEQLMEVKRKSESTFTIDLIDAWIQLNYKEEEYPELFL